jgi:hypothetical protein
VKFEDKLVELNDIAPFKGLMLMKLIELNDPEFKPFSIEYDKVVLLTPGRRSCCQKG